jgi:hypothetical protein
MQPRRNREGSPTPQADGRSQPPPSFCVTNSGRASQSSLNAGRKPGASALPRPSRGRVSTAPVRQQSYLLGESSHRTNDSSHRTNSTGMESVEEALHNSYSSTDSQLAPPMKVALLQAAPLVIGRDAKAVDQLDLKHERDTVLDALRKTRKHMHVSCDFCTTRRLRELMTEGCRILHYSGHGFSFIDRNGQPQARLAFENGEGGTHELEVKNLTDLVAAGAEADGAPPLDFAFISAVRTCRCRHARRQLAPPIQSPASSHTCLRHSVAACSLSPHPAPSPSLRVPAVPLRGRRRGLRAGGRAARGGGAARSAAAGRGGVRVRDGLLLRALQRAHRQASLRNRPAGGRQLPQDSPGGH